VACRETGEKRTLIRLVRLIDGRVVVDGRGRLPGRGAYLCAKLECWQAGISGNRLEHGLKMSLSQEDKARLMAEGRALIGGS
jgi:predicted RNA-binding protein YlxR (DUF448 family)